MPSKALLRPGELLAEVSARARRCEAVTGELDVAAVLARRDEVIHDLDDSGQLPWLERPRDRRSSAAAAALDGERRVRRRRRRSSRARRSSSRPAAQRASRRSPGSPRRARGPTARRRPRSRSRRGSSILGGGVVGVEMAQAWAPPRRAGDADRGAATGSSPREEPFAGEQVADALASSGVDVRTGAKASRGRARDGGRSRSSSRTAAARGGDELLVAVGRRPAPTSIGLETARAASPARDVEVDDTHAGRRARLAVRDRRRQRPRAAHPHGQVPGADRRPTTILGAGRRSCARDGGALAARDLHRPAGRGRRLRSRPREEAGLDVRAVDVETAATRAARFVGRAPRARRGSSSTRTARVLVGATFIGAGDRRVAARGDDRRRRRGPARRPLARGARLPDAVGALAPSARGVRALSRDPSSEGWPSGASWMTRRQRTSGD